MEELVSESYSPPPLAQVGRWASIHEVHEHALVLLAMGVDYSIHPEPGGYGLYTAEPDAAPAQQELDIYSAEQSISRNIPPATQVEEHPAGIPWLALWALILLTTYLKQVSDPSITSRFSNSTAALLDGEWWRPFTALLLHGDLIHLLGNILIGGIFCLLAAKSLGVLRAWALILTAGTMGNTLNALLHQQEAFSSIGASTATFAAVGLLVGSTLIQMTGNWRQSLRPLLVPLTTGLLLFSMFGASGENTDIGGHVWGGLCGMFFGGCNALLRRFTETRRQADHLAFHGPHHGRWLG